MKHPTVVADAFANSAGEHVVRPRPRASFQVGCDIRGNQPGNALVCVDVSRTLLANDRRSAGLGPVASGVTTKAVDRTAFASPAEHQIRDRTGARCAWSLPVKAP